jgi:hypothetical protein
MRVPPLAQESGAADGEAEPIPMSADDADSEAMPADRWIGRRSSGARAEWLRSTRAAAFEDTAQGFWKNALAKYSL